MATLSKPQVFTNGVFDVLHRGHVTDLEQARALGSCLLVALNTDASARRLGKASEHPLSREEDRALLIATLGMVDCVTWFDENTPGKLISEVRPDILVKGANYDMRKLPETTLIESWGGKAMALLFSQGYSTTALVKKIQAGS